MALKQTIARSRSSPDIVTATPPSSRPTRLAAGTRQSSKASSPVGEPRKPILFSFCATRKPGVSVSTMKAEMPLAPFSGEVLA